MQTNPSSHFSDSTSRRAFLSSSLAGAAALPLAQAGAQEVIAAIGKMPKAEQIAIELIASLSDEQRARVVLPYDHRLRQRVENNWHILGDKRVGTEFSSAQQTMLRTIFRELHSTQMTEAVWAQFLKDNRTSQARTPDEIFGTASVAIFQDAGSELFELVITGRHTTRRCTNVPDTTTAFGGPIFYGHAVKFYEEADHAGNAYWFQAERANVLYELLDSKQQLKALKNKSRGERGSRTVALSGQKEGLEGLPAWELSVEQKNVLIDIIADLLLPFRTEDRIAAARMINAQLDDLHIAYYKEENIGEDTVWDTWKIEGPQVVWYFRGDPHVHVWAHVKAPEAAA